MANFSLSEDLILTGSFDHGEESAGDTIFRDGSPIADDKLGSFLGDVDADPGNTYAFDLKNLDCCDSSGSYYVQISYYPSQDSSSTELFTTNSVNYTANEEEYTEPSGSLTVTNNNGIYTLSGSINAGSHTELTVEDYITLTASSDGNDIILSNVDIGPGTPISPTLSINIDITDNLAGYPEDTYTASISVMDDTDSNPYPDGEEYFKTISTTFEYVEEDAENEPIVTLSLSDDLILTGTANANGSDLYEIDLHIYKDDEGCLYHYGVNDTVSDFSYFNNLLTTGIDLKNLPSGFEGDSEVLEIVDGSSYKAAVKFYASTNYSDGDADEKDPVFSNTVIYQSETDETEEAPSINFSNETLRDLWGELVSATENICGSLPEDALGNKRIGIKSIHDALISHLTLTRSKTTNLTPGDYMKGIAVAARYYTNGNSISSATSSALENTLAEIVDMLKAPYTCSYPGCLKKGNFESTDYGGGELKYYCCEGHKVNVCGYCGIEYYGDACPDCGVITTSYDYANVSGHYIVTYNGAGEEINREGPEGHYDYGAPTCRCGANPHAYWNPDATCSKWYMSEDEAESNCGCISYISCFCCGTSFASSDGKQLCDNCSDSWTFCIDCGTPILNTGGICSCGIGISPAGIAYEAPDGTYYCIECYHDEHCDCTSGKYYVYCNNYYNGTMALYVCPYKDHVSYGHGADGYQMGDTWDCPTCGVAHEIYTS